MGTSSLHCLKLDPGLRRSVGEALVPTSKIKVCMPSFQPYISVDDCVGGFVRDLGSAGARNNPRAPQEALHTPFRSVCLCEVGGRRG